VSRNGGESRLPKAEHVEDALKRLCTRGVEPYWVRKKGGILLTMECVRKRAEADFGGAEDSEVDALVAILRELVKRMGNSEYAKVIWIVLALDEDYFGLEAQKRREIAGLECRDGLRPLRPSTIRTIYERVAREQLTKLLLQTERNALDERSEEPAE
jgi:hypothetical protein